jgi:hypothetical protein
VVSSAGRIGADIKSYLEIYPVRNAIAVTRNGGALHLTAELPATAQPQVAGVVLRFPKCMDASAWKGVRFTIRGSYSGCSLHYATIDPQHEDRSNDEAPFAAGWRDSSPPQVELARSQVTSVTQTVSVPFDDEEAVSRAIPPLPLDRSQLTGVRWQLTVPAGRQTHERTAACVVDLYVDDVSFY